MPKNANFSPKRCITKTKRCIKKSKISKIIINKT